jgi:hypothetical protein
MTAKVFRAMRADGRPDFHYVATYICDSIKRRLKTRDAAGIQGEFGIGLLSFWTVGEKLAMTSTGGRPPWISNDHAESRPGLYR